jgi:hypothetical protein
MAASRGAPRTTRAHIAVSGSYGGLRRHALDGLFRRSDEPRRVGWSEAVWGQGTLGLEAVEQGATSLVFLDPPFAGARIMVGGDDADPTLTIPYEQATYVFVHAPAHR